MRNCLLLLLFSWCFFSCLPNGIKPDAVEYKIDKPQVVEFKQVKLETIVILGSSTASGIGASQYKYSWAGLLRSQFLAGQVINLSKPGYTTYQILPNKTSHAKGRPDADTLHNITAALERKPTILLISMTTNDVGNGYSVDEVMTNLALVRAKAAAAGVKRIFITTSHPRRINPTATAQYMLQRDRILKTYGSCAINFFDPVADSENCFKAELLCSDGLHPNDKGHAVLHEQVKKALKL